MACFHPMTAFRQEGGGISFRETKHSLGSILLPCGQCVGCRMKRAGEWSIRLFHEFRMSDQVACFATWTYDDAHLPADGGLDYSHMQACFRSMRRAGLELRHYTCGEYGSKPDHPFMNIFGDLSLGRPHYHAIIFKQDFRSDRKLHSRSGAGCDVFTSERFSSFWDHGFCVLSDVSPQSIAYVSKHNFKKISGRDAPEYYSRVDALTGEFVYVKPEFSRMSLKPGIGAGWLERFGESDVFPHDNVVVDGRVLPVPKYYQKRFKELHPLQAEWQEYERFLVSQKHADDQTPERLAVREYCAERKIIDARKRRGGVF